MLLTFLAIQDTQLRIGDNPTDAIAIELMRTFPRLSSSLFLL